MVSIGDKFISIWMDTKWKDSSTQLHPIEVQKADGAEEITDHMPMLSFLKRATEPAAMLPCVRL